MDGNYWPAPMYAIANNRYQLKAIPLEGQWVNAGWMRAGSSPHATFAGEQVIDELAHAAGMDPVAFRIQNVTTDDTTRTAARRADGRHQGRRLAAEGGSVQALERRRRQRTRLRLVERLPRPDPRRRRSSTSTVNKKTGKITVKHVYQAFSAGLLISPGLVENQLVGGITQIVSRVMIEQLPFNKTNVTSSDFVSYPLLRFKDSPKVTPIVLQRTDLTPTESASRSRSSLQPRSRTRSSTPPASGCGQRPSRPRASARR